MSIIRNYCIICNNNILLDNFQLISTIDMVSLIPYDKSEIFDLQFVGCSNCGCVQLKKLFDTSIVYEQPIQCVDGPLLKQHHELFANFVFENSKYYDELLEIGGSYGKIAKKIIDKYKCKNIEINYKIVEFNIEHYPEIKNIEYISGNCETYDFNKTKTIIMSHVFEHLYKPIEFVKTINNSNVQEVFISIPDMKNLMKNGDINNLNIFHTFYLDTTFLEYIFNINNYELVKLSNYKETSIFYYFKKNIEYNITPKYFKQLHLLNTISDFYKNIKEKIQILDIKDNFYICPAGFYGRFVYNYLHSDTKKYVNGFLDGDMFKINKRLSGTPFMIYDKKYISNLDNTTILICSEKHKDELTNELIKYNQNIKFYYL
jgi:hypothetical protein